MLFVMKSLLCPSVHLYSPACPLNHRNPPGWEGDSFRGVDNFAWGGGGGGGGGAKIISVITN